MSQRSRSSRQPAPVPQFQIAVVSGTIRGEVVLGRTSVGEPVCSFDLVVDDGGGRCLVPVTWRGVERPALAAGAAVAVRGRITKRFHRAGATTVARTALEAVEVAHAPRSATLQRLTDRALDAARGSTRA